MGLGVQHSDTAATVGRRKSHHPSHHSGHDDRYDARSGAGDCAALSQCDGYPDQLDFFAELIRGTPLLVQLYFLFYILPDLGLLLSPLTAGVVGLGLHYSTYTAEVYRTGIDAIPSGQWEASKAANLTARQTWIHIIIPQAIPPMIPALANYFVVDVQGNALAGCDHRAGVDESSTFCCQLSLQICGTDDDGRPVLFSGQCALGHLATQT